MFKLDSYVLNKISSIVDDAIFDENEEFYSNTCDGCDSTCSGDCSGGCTGDCQTSD